tara:strand:+ start:17262 stop:17708 length:447 start_codon:yes stop_codon:yes gene_type:complete
MKMKKRTLYIATTLAFLSFTIVSCGSNSVENSEVIEENVIAETIDEVIEEIEEEIVSDEVDTATGEKLFGENGCVACHQKDTKVIGPSLIAISEGYAGDKATLASFLNGESDPIIDPEQAVLMAPQVEITKKMSAEERTALTDYILSH